MVNFDEIKIFKGIKDDEDSKDIPIDYFYKVINFNYPDTGVNGFEKILMPERINNIGSNNVDGIFEYRFLDTNNKIQIQNIGVCNGTIYKDILDNPVVLRSGITKGRCSFAVLNDKLYIANGKDYIYVYDGAKGVVSQMGAPISTEGSIGVLNGTYYWAITFITAGGEEILGSVSNSLTLLNKRVNLTIPIGYAGTISRKIYRTGSNGSILKLLTTISDNTTLNYIDNSLDSSLGTVINSPTNELPKPYFISVFNEKLVGAKTDLYPTQIFISDSEIDIFDLANGLDIANYADDNSPVEGIGIDFSNIVIGTKKHIYLVDISESIPIITTTRVNVGIKDGYSVKRIPTYGNFNGGLMFVSSNNDIRILVGIRAIPVATSVDNIFSEDISQNIKGSLYNELKSPSNIYAEYHNYRYYLVINNNKYVYDIRTNGWTFHNIQSDNYKSNPIILGVLNNILYNGQPDGWIEQEYKHIKYRDEEIIALVESANIAANNKYKYIQKLIFWLLPSAENKISLDVISDDDKYFAEEKTFDLLTGEFDDEEFDNNEFNIAEDLDYRIFNVHKPVRWIKFILKIIEGNIMFNSWGIYIKQIAGE